MTKQTSAVFNLAAKFKTVVEDGVFDTLLFSDRYRRGVPFSDARDGMGNSLAGLVRQLGVRSTYYYGELPETHSHNRDVLATSADIVRDIDWRAAKLGATKTILPFASRGNAFALALKHTLKKQDFLTSPVLRGRAYDSDLSALGPIQRDRPTIFDQGVRGVCHYKHELRPLWDRQVA